MFSLNRILLPFLCFLIILCSGAADSVYAQHLRVEARTPVYTDYVLVNDSLRAGPWIELEIPYNPASQTWRILSQDIVEQVLASETDLPPEMVSSRTGTPLIEVTDPGIYRKQRVATLIIHTVRPADTALNRYYITRELRIRIFTEPVWHESAFTARSGSFIIQNEESPLASGTWYKIPVSRDGIHQLNRSYLQALGISVGTVDPRKIQLWATDGYEMPHQNDAPRSEFKQLPILVEGESDGSFDQNDRILFYGNSPHQTRFDLPNRTYIQQIHPYSDVKYVFLTIGQDNGLRLTPTVYPGTPVETITTFRDILWKEEELRKPESRLKSGNQWLGQQFTTESFASNQVIFRDTVSGFVQGSAIEYTAFFAARASGTSRFDILFQGNNHSFVNLSSAGDLNASIGIAASVNAIFRNISTVTLPDDILELRAQFSSTRANALGWLDWIRIRLNREIKARNGYLLFRGNDFGNGQLSTFRMSGFTGTPLVLDVTSPTEPLLLPVTQNGSAYEVSGLNRPGGSFIAQTAFISPQPGTQVANQNLRGLPFNPQYIVITTEEFLGEATELANYRESRDGLRAVVVLQDHIFNEFSGGIPDAVGIRDYVRYFYNRAGNDPDQMPKYLLFFGDTTYDYKGIQKEARLKNHLITFQSRESLIRTDTYGSDDFFVLLDDDEGAWVTGGFGASAVSPERIDMGVGRLPIQNRQEARILLEKIYTYDNPETFGDWRSLITFSADDNVNGSDNTERDLHVLNADGSAESIDRDQAGVRIGKVYQLSYPVYNTPVGRLAPEATQAFVDAINNGTLLMNYSGHGSEQLLASEQLFKSDDISRLTNRDKLTIFITVTCEFGRYDDEDEQSGAEKLMLWDRGGAIASYTTSRVVYTSATPTILNFGLNIQLTRAMVERDSDGKPLSFGEIYRRTKNTTVGRSFNSRKFIFLGDPAQKIGLPVGQLQITSINGLPANQRIQLRSLDEAVIEGFVDDGAGNINTAYNGEANVKVYDAVRFQQLPDFPLRSSQGCYTPNCEYRIENDVIFSGRVSITNGTFRSRFIVPRDISYSDTTGRILIYGFDGITDGVGSFSNIVLNGRNELAVNDNAGPDVRIFLNDFDFVDGALVNESPELIVELADESGINTAGAGIGHELIASVGTRPRTGPETTYMLNEFYESELDDYTRGTARYGLQDLADGQYTLSVRAWDVFNNMSEASVTFEVKSAEDLDVRNVYNYPNPMSGYTRFVFEHNQAGEPMDVLVRIFTLSGRPVAQLRRDGLVSAGNYAIIEWDGRDDDLNLLASGTYLYHVRVRTDGAGGPKVSENIERLVIIR